MEHCNYPDHTQHYFHLEKHAKYFPEVNFCYLMHAIENIPSLIKYTSGLIINFERVTLKIY